MHYYDAKIAQKEVLECTSDGFRPPILPQNLRNSSEYIFSFKICPVFSAVPENEDFSGTCSYLGG